jgi:glycosyltransferase involved in cell wall biosynthesis
MSDLTVVIPFLNEREEIERTLRSLRDTSDDVDVILVDDVSDPFPYEDVAKKYDAKYIRNEERIGVAGSRDLGVSLSKTPNVLIIDGHMRFKNDDWHKKIPDAISADPECAYCTVCLGLGYGRSEITDDTPKYAGGHIQFVTDMKGLSREILEPKWLPWQEGLSGRVYEIPCILGANYAFSVEFYKKIKGLEGLRMWGCDEVYLSMKAWQAGGSCKLLGNVEIGHIFRDSAPYVTGVENLFYNKLLLCRTILPDSIGINLAQRLPLTNDHIVAQQMVRKNVSEICNLKSYYNSIFTRGLDEVAKIVDARSITCSR